MLPGRATLFENSQSIKGNIVEDKFTCQPNVHDDEINFGAFDFNKPLFPADLLTTAEGGGPQQRRSLNPDG